MDHNINITFPDIDGDYLFSKLNDISLSSGSACGSGSGETSYVLKEIGINKIYARSTLRIGIGKDNTKNDLIYCASKIGRVLLVFLRDFAQNFRGFFGSMYPKIRFFQFRHLRAEISQH